MTRSQVKIVWLDARAEAQEETLGPKAVSLIRLRRIGLPIPPGFCIPVAVYREHLELNGILRQVLPALDAGRTKERSVSPAGACSAGDGRQEGAESPLFRPNLQRVHDAIIRAPVPEEFRRVLEVHYHQLGARYVAVRSSATAEDLPGRSFAGQYETYLGIVNVEGCLAAVRQCWASLWTERAWEYCRRNGLDPPAVGMAVIVQALVPAAASGVLFTADPITGRRDQITMEACWGLGESLLSGQVTPDRFLVRKRDLHLLSRLVREKPWETVPDGRGGVRQQPVPPARRSRASLERRTVIRLARLAKRAEARLGGPQDLEWAVQGQRVFFLQARPITVLPAAPSEEDRQIWTNANLGEVFPDVMTPLTQSFAEITNRTLLRPALTILGLKYADREKLLRPIAGRLYFNATLGMAIVRHLPGGQRFDYHALVGGGPAATPIDRGEGSPELNADLAGMILRIPWSIHLLVAHRQARARASIEALRASNCRLQDLDCTRLSLKELGRAFLAVTRDGAKKLDLLYAVLTNAPLALLYRVCERWLNDGDHSLANQLLTDTGDMASARAGLDLWRLATEARTVPPVRRTLLSETRWPAVQETLSTTDAGRAFLRSWDRFLACHGHHCRGEIELYNPRWSETPDYLLTLLRGYLVREDLPDPRHDQQERARRREQVQQHCRGQLRNPVRRLVFERLVYAARNGSALRENFKNESIRWIATLRRLLLAIGSRLAAAGVLRERDDVFFLQLQEIEALLHSGQNFDLPRLLAARRAEYQRNRSIVPPSVIVGRFDPDQHRPEPPTAEAGTNVLHGVAASAGIATGPARVVLRADTGEQIRPGEILVAPSTDPGWIPYFVPAAGLVTDQGGLLSHGSIIAREYGLPAVVNVPAATRIIQTGQRLRIDGNRGVVTILSGRRTSDSARKSHG